MKSSVEQRDAGVEDEQIVANLRAWILDLRSNPDKQQRGTMGNVDGSRMCCLGRAALVLGPLTPLQIVSRLPYESVRDAMGLGEAGLSLCINMNDGLVEFAGAAQTFPQIADWIERELLPRYITPSPLPPSEGRGNG